MEATSIKSSLNTYSSVTGQLINWEKSSIFFINTPEGRQQKISIILGCSIAILPSSYLGLHLYLQPPESFWDDLVDKFNSKLVGWKGNLLSQDGKVTLLNIFIYNLPTYSLSLFKIPAKYADIIERIKHNFICSSMEETKIISLISWDQLCNPKSRGGLGIRPIKYLNKTLLANKIWRMYGEDKEWNLIGERKYLFDSPSLDTFLLPPNVENRSFIQSSMEESKHLAGIGSRWKLGDGKSIKFWEDYWLRDYLLMDFFDDRDLIHS